MLLEDLKNRISAIAAECGGDVSVAVRHVANAADLSLSDDVVVSSASVIKIPILIEALRRVREADLDLEREISLSGCERVRGAGVLRHLSAELTLTVRDLLWLMIIVSDNTATNIIIDLLETEAVNATLRAMGCQKTALRRKLYDWAAIERGIDNVCTAGEIAGLLARVARHEALGDDWDELMLDMLRHQQDVSRLGLMLPDEARLANKTGSRQGIYHDCGIVSTEAFSYSIAVLTRDAHTQGDAHLAIARISRAVYDHFAGAL